MADRLKLAAGLRNLPASAREDLAGREQDIQRGKTVELLRRAGKEMYENPIVNTAIGFTPGVGDVQAAGETFAALQRNAPWQETAGYAAGMLPFVPALGGIVAPNVARELNTLRKLPEDDIFKQAVANTPGARVTEEGLFMNLQRGQKPEQEAMESVRGGVFYLPEGSSNMRHYKGGDYGGKQMIEGETLINNPLFVKGATGGKAPEAAYDQLIGKGAYQAMRNDVLNSYSSWGNQPPKVEAIQGILEKYNELDPDDAYNMAYNIVSNSKTGNTLPYAVQENIVGNAVRNAGHDVVLGYSKGKQGPFLSEVFDVREPYYPYETGEAPDIWDVYKK